MLHHILGSLRRTRTLVQLNRRFGQLDLTREELPMIAKGSQEGVDDELRQRLVVWTDTETEAVLCILPIADDLVVRLSRGS